MKSFPIISGQNEIVKIEGKSKLKTIIENTYKPDIIEFVNLQKNLFNQSVWLTGLLDVYQLIRPIDGFLEEKIIEEIIVENNL